MTTALCGHEDGADDWWTTIWASALSLNPHLCGYVLKTTPTFPTTTVKTHAKPLLTLTLAHPPYRHRGHAAPTRTRHYCPLEPPPQHNAATPIPPQLSPTQLGNGTGSGNPHGSWLRDSTGSGTGGSSVNSSPVLLPVALRL
ncbi:hypothetical protein EDB89DRAFT_1907825 [Lactarius sanguifluus]|nr:hypothetical protein EDB89DRAFT_1907825 [Lactarius sanguifluus]